MTRSVSASQAAKDYALASSSPVEFIDRFCLIRDENTGAVKRFRLWPYQKQLLQEWTDHKLNVDLKARQLGVSWLVCGFALWLANFYDNMTIICVSKTQDKAWDLIQKIKFMYDNLPPHLKKEVSKRNQGVFQFMGENDVGDETEEGSRVLAIASTPGSGVGFTATVVICDEWGEQDYAEELYSALKPTIDMGGRFIGLGTGDSVGSFYHEICTKAQSGENGFFFHFLGWWLRPGRHTLIGGMEVPDMDWYQRTRSGYPNLQEFLRMYPSSPIESFIAAGGCPFSIEDLNFYEETYVKPPLSWESLSNNHWTEKLINFARVGELHVWEKPLDSFPYLISMDVATGKEDGGDYHVIQVIKTSNMEQVAELQTRCDTDQACAAAVELARIYNLALLVWESTGVGHAATNVFVRSDYGQLYEHEDLNQERVARRTKVKTTEKKAIRLGWPASRSMNAIRDQELIAGFREHSIIIHSGRWLNEAKGFVRQNDGSYSASGRAHDDLITSLGQGFHVALRRMNKRVLKAKPIRSTRRRAFKKERWS